MQGEDFRQYEWVPGQDALPPTVQALVAVGAQNNVSAVPYIYPILGFTRPEALGGDPWLYPRGGGERARVCCTVDTVFSVHPHSSRFYAGKYYASLANREFQDYLIASVVAFGREAGAWGAGYGEHVSCKCDECGLSPKLPILWSRLHIFRGPRL